MQKNKCNMISGTPCMMKNEKIVGILKFSHNRETGIIFAFLQSFCLFLFSKQGLLTSRVVAFLTFLLITAFVNLDF